MRRFNLWAGVFLLALSLFVCVESSRMGLGEVAVPGPGFLPFWTAFALGCFSLVLISGDIRKGRAEVGPDILANILWKKWAVTVGSLFLYLFLLEALGFIVVTLIFMVVLLVFVEPMRWISVALISVITTLSAYLLFETLLKSQLPRGIFGF